MTFLMKYVERPSYGGSAYSLIRLWSRLTAQNGILLTSVYKESLQFYLLTYWSIALHDFCTWALGYVSLGCDGTVFKTFLA